MILLEHFIVCRCNGSNYRNSPMEKIEVHGKKLNKRLIELQDNSSIRCWWIYYIDSDFFSRDKILIV